MKKLILFDKSLFLKINRDWSNPFFDQVMPFLRTPSLWIPFYLFLFVFMVINFGRRAWAWILFFVVTVSATDIISSRFIKPGFARLRPCNDETVSSTIRMLAEYCGQNGSFTSSHAANHFGMAVFLFLTLRSIIGKWSGLIFIWAAMICYAQVYIGVHFPFDVAGGALLGFIIGSLTASVFNKRFGLVPDQR